MPKECPKQAPFPSEWVLKTEFRSEQRSTSRYTPWPWLRGLLHVWRPSASRSRSFQSTDTRKVQTPSWWCEGRPPAPDPRCCSPPEETHPQSFRSWSPPRHGDGLRQKNRAPHFASLVSGVLLQDVARPDHHPCCLDTVERAALLLLHQDLTSKHNQLDQWEIEFSLCRY